MLRHFAHTKGKNLINRVIIDNLKNALGDTDKSQLLKAVSVIDKLSPINFAVNFLCLTKFFSCKSNHKCFSRFFKKTEQFTDSAVGLNTTKRDFSNCNKTLSTP